MKKMQPTISYSIVQGTSLGLCAVLLGYAGNFLYRHGFEDHHISLLLGSSMGLSCILQLGAGELISRSKRLTPAAVLCVVGMLMLTGCAMMFIDSVSVAAVAGLALAITMLQTTPGVVNAMGMDAIAKGSNTNFSVARGVGSVTYGLLALVSGLAVTAFGLASLAALGCLITALMIFGVIWFRRCGTSDPVIAVITREKPQKSQGNFLKKYLLFGFFLLGTMLLMVAHNLGCSFMFQVITAKGGDASEQGIATFIAAAVELPVMFGFPWMLKRMRCEKWIILSPIFFVIKLMGMFFATGCGGVYAAQTAQLLGYALFTIGSVHYAGLAVDKEETVRAQSYLSTAGSLGALIAVSIGGVLCKLMGVQSMLLVASAFGMAGTVVIVAAVQLHRRKQK